MRSSPVASQRSSLNGRWRNFNTKEAVSMTGKPWETKDDIEANISAFVELVQNQKG
jgi:hypothetical protein